MSITGHFERFIPFGNIKKKDLKPLYTLQYLIYCDSDFFSHDPELLKKIDITKVSEKERSLYVSEVIKFAEDKHGCNACMLDGPIHSVSDWVRNIPDQSCAFDEFTLSASARPCIQRVFGKNYVISKAPNTPGAIQIAFDNTVEKFGKAAFVGWGKLLSEYYSMAHASVKNFEKLAKYFMDREEDTEWKTDSWKSIVSNFIMKEGPDKVRVEVHDIKSSENTGRSAVFSLLPKCGFERVHPEQNCVWTMDSSTFATLGPWYRRIIKRNLNSNRMPVLSSEIHGDHENLYHKEEKAMNSRQRQPDSEPRIADLERELSMLKLERSTGKKRTTY